MIDGESKAALLDEALGIRVCPDDMIQSLKRTWQEEQAKGSSKELDARVEYAIALSNTQTRNNLEDAILLMEQSLDAEQYRSQLLMQLALTNYALGRYDAARTWCEELLTRHPDHQQVKDYFQAIAYKHNKQKESKILE